MGKITLWLLLSIAVCCWLRQPAEAATPTAEKLIYELSWGLISTGTATQEISTQGETVKIVSTARSNAWLSSFYPVEDIVESSLLKGKAPYPGLVQKYRMKISEGSRRRDREIIFDHRAGKARYIDHLGGEQLDVPITPLTYDIYSSFFHVRHLPLQVGNHLQVDVLDGKKLRRIEVQVLRKEKLKTILGKVDTIVVKPMVASEGVFEDKGGATIWLTDDERRIPVKVQTKVKVGSITATLVGGSF